MPEIYNKNNDNVPAHAIYVGRGSPFGNPFRIVNGRRDKAIMKFREWLLSQPELVEKVKHDLRGKDLVCYCAPAFCHAEILMEIANGT
ncbi:hypothetical protein vBRpoSV10_89 [Ruegeria phage vB_RpoS-V10]|nr:hypothetical protein DSS3P8_089 [Roseobacter phage DSS3P8]AWY09211.1 hypothetical protein vBRpoSV10_89 [Ruegeria phage vB_RpoS-V10]